MDFVIKFSARTATLFQTFARMPILFIFCKFYKVPSTKAASLLPPLASSSRSPSLLRSSRLYEVLAFIQKLTFEKEPKRLSVGQARNRMETNGGDPGKFSQAAFLGSQPRNLRRPQTARLTAKKIAAACLPVVEYWYMFPSNEAYIPRPTIYSKGEKIMDIQIKARFFQSNPIRHYRDAL